MRLGLGRLPKKEDSRNLRAADYVLVEVAPEEYNFDRGRAHFPILDQDGWPACTVFSAATSQMRLERLEQRRTVKFNPQDLVAAYVEIAQPGGGAYMLDMLKQRRTRGYVGEVGWFPWLRRRYVYRIDAFAEVHIGEQELKRAMVAFRLLEIGVWVTARMIGQRTGLVEPEADEKLLGGHALCAYGYDRRGVWIADTWARFGRRQLSWSYLWRYCDEAYSVVDSLDVAAGAGLVNAKRLAQDVRAVTHALGGQRGYHLGEPQDESGFHLRSGPKGE